MQDKQLLLPLAHGELSAQDLAELAMLKALVQERSGLNIEYYKEKCLRRRIAVRMRARGVHRYGDYVRIIAEDPGEYDRLLDALTINVSKFFRNNEVWQRMRETVIPELFDRKGPVRIWSAGCASGEEPYTVAIELLEFAAAHGRESELSKFHILGTDLDRESLANAQRAVYGDFSLAETPAEIRERWFLGEQRRQLDPRVTRLVNFRALDLLSDSYPSQMSLILCRNVIIYFERSVQEGLFMRFEQSLLPGGLLLLGKVETLFGSVARSFRSISGRDRLFRKL